jgi:hypothetical protein
VEELLQHTLIVDNTLTMNVRAFMPTSLRSVGHAKVARRISVERRTVEVRRRSAALSLTAGSALPTTW